ncbi:hypothetical protein KEJ18_02900 [Candidatus Bathyarchaeota archaeon]|nr:hypothetical protein [Candidatus Bathyarchaeota archaeon]
MSEEKLADFLKTGKDWSRTRTSIPGVFVLKLPPYRASPARLVAELNPIDETGNPKKRRGIVLRSSAELEEFKKMFQDEKLPKLLSMIDKINPEVKVGKGRKGEEGFIEL